MSENKKLVEVEVEGQKVNLAVLRPNHRVQQKSQQIHNKAFREAVESGAIVRARIEAVMREQKLWDDAKQANYEQVMGSLLDAEKKLAKGGIKLKEARDVAVQMRRDRVQLRFLSSDRNQLDQNTAEAQAENARFNFLVSACTVFADTGKSYYQDFDDYQARESDPVAALAANALGKMIYGLEDNFEHKLPENKFLVQYGFADEKLHLIDPKTKHLVDDRGRAVDDKGRLVNDKGELVDAEGNLLTEEGDYKFEFTPFLDEEDKPVTV
jgi:hypothetical protein